MRRLLLLTSVALTACATQPAPTVRSILPAAAATRGTLLRLVESQPIETTLDHADVADAFAEWPRLIASAQTQIDVAQFYVSNAPGSRLEPIIAALEAAALRGVKVRLLADSKFAKTYPETLDRLAKQPNTEVRRFDVGAIMGGVLHAKYFLVDRKLAFVGSQNFDWRALEHIQELGVEVADANAVKALQDVFEMDWTLAAGGKLLKDLPKATFPSVVEDSSETTRVTPVFSPKGFLPDDTLWDLPRLVSLLDSAKQTVRVQVLTFKANSRNNREPFPDLEDALVRAGGRGVKVQLLVSEWATRKNTLAGLSALAKHPNVEIKVLTVPRWSGGDIPFARVAHAKYLAVDGERSWVGTSNWERDYFYESRNVGFVFEGKAFTERLERFFDDNWRGKYSGPLP